MNLRSLFFVICAATCLATVLCVVVQGRQLSGLRTEQHRLLSESRPADDASIQSPVTTQSPEPRSTTAPSLELLQLRSEVTRLTNRRRELAVVTNEGAQLIARLRERGTNAQSGSALPPGYILRSRAQQVGFNTPDDAIQTFLWALQARNFNALLQALTPGSAEIMAAQLRRSRDATNEFFKEAEAWVGMAIVDPQQLPDGSIEASVQIVPGIPPEKLRFQLIAGQWKIEMPH